ncbi:hypothetical protein F5H01DRAFT_414562 [Linnemannia elongata]|nr:hypothetical protein F5H01DRAFT_414562 [Linnemannia elongata]
MQRMLGFAFHSNPGTSIGKGSEQEGNNQGDRQKQNQTDRPITLMALNFPHSLSASPGGVFLGTEEERRRSVRTILPVSSSILSFRFVHITIPYWSVAPADLVVFISRCYYYRVTDGRQRYKIEESTHLFACVRCAIVYPGDSPFVKIYLVRQSKQQPKKAKQSASKKAQYFCCFYFETWLIPLAFALG